MSLIFLTDTLSVKMIDSNSGRDRHGCFRVSTSWTELLDVSVTEGGVAWSVVGDCSLELLDALSV